MSEAAAATAGAAELDELTLKRAQRGEAAACTALVKRYQRPVFAVVSRMLSPSGRRAAVEDVAQETFLRVFRALPSFNLTGGAKLSTWILTIATRVTLNELRKRAATGESLDELAAPPLGAPVELRALGRAIERAVGGLAPEYRAAFVLREFHELSYEEIARALDVDVGTVKSRLSRARAALKSALAEVHHE
ncbi:MAG: putative polymerase ECF-type sigma factor [Myxococcales bacterium]|nr:putative polymerase ECF-type sigma factor [Myxococcales bacterium]